MADVVITATYLEVPLTQGLVAIVDAADEQLVAAFNWYAARKPRTTYAQRGFRRGGLHTTQMMHSLITGWPIVDHINGCGLDNRRANLRAATSQQNGLNRQAVRGAASQYKGVHRHHADERWRAQIRVNRKARHLGLFTDEIEAALTYDVAARDLFGAFAALNFPRPGERPARSQ